MTIVYIFASVIVVSLVSLIGVIYLPLQPPPLAFTNVSGDGLHNFLDGVIIAGSYFISPAAGLATTLAVVLHEIPQEIGDFGVLVDRKSTRLNSSHSSI